MSCASFVTNVVLRLLFVGYGGIWDWLGFGFAEGFSSLLETFICMVCSLGYVTPISMSWLLNHIWCTAGDVPRGTREGAEDSIVRYVPTGSHSEPRGEMKGPSSAVRAKTPCEANIDGTDEDVGDIQACRTRGLPV